METQLQKYDPDTDLAPVPKIETAVEPVKLDATQARIDHVSALLSAAYQKASTLELSDDERAKLTAMLPDSDICTGAGGDANLLYIQHGSIRKILFDVFGPGRWALINRRTFMQDGFVFADCVLVVRGCYVGEAIGAHRWTPNNARMNYSDAIESAQSESLRRIAGKYLSIGIQVWDKHYCEAWKQRQKSGGAAGGFPSNPKPAERIAGDGRAASPTKPADVLPKTATAETLKWFIAQCEPMREQVENYLRHTAKLLPTEPLEELPLKDVPTSKAAFMEFTGKVDEWIRGQQQEGGAAAQEDDSWRASLMPFGKNMGIKLEDLEKPYLFGLWANYEVETEYNGKPKKPETIAKDQEFRRMLDLCGQHYEFKKD